MKPQQMLIALGIGIIIIMLLGYVDSDLRVFSRQKIGQHHAYIEDPQNSPDIISEPRHPTAVPPSDEPETSGLLYSGDPPNLGRAQTNVKGGQFTRKTQDSINAKDPHDPNADPVTFGQSGNIVYYVQVDPNQLEDAATKDIHN